MTEMRVTSGAENFHPPHQKAKVILVLDTLVLRGSPETRPTRTGIVFRVRGE